MNITINGMDLEVLNMEQLLPFVGCVVVMMVIGWVIVSIMVQKERDRIIERRLRSLERDWMEYILSNVDALHEEAADRIKKQKC